ncbi:uncharacterized protein LOC121781156 [Salvia splendens]|uniref:uncharacterized protein LOC121781156 n=1 Tax=Salvia splendens TaxID=180675 RepID=UPI001C2812E8|nr:uncharacterized protein LOC121781156 [Salvia splendens]
MRTLSDQAMTFCSVGPSSPKQASKKAAMKLAKAKLKSRKSTPAPPTKENDRKRFIPSPLPEDKQLRKKIDFGEEEGTPLESPKFKGAIFPATSNKEIEGIIRPKTCEQRDFNDELDLDKPIKVCEAPPNNSRFSDQDSDRRAGEGPAADEVTVIQPSHGNTLILVAAKTKEVLEEERVKLLEMNMGTKEVLESGLVSYHNGDSRDALDLGGHVQSNPTNLLLVASLDLADTLDAMETQPLIDAGKVDIGRPAAEPNWILRIRNDPSPITPSSAFKNYHEEFPPLEKGRTLKLRDSFESGRPRGSQPPPSSQSSQDVLQNAGAMAHSQESPTNPAITPNVVEQEEIITTTTMEGTMACQFKVNPSTAMNATHNRAEKGVRPDPGVPKQAGGAAVGTENTIAWRSMADMIKEVPDPNGPQVFAPDKLQTIGLAMVSNGIPAIYFLGVEIQKLAENMGHGIVDKFSLSIPSVGQIQKALNNIKFQCGFTWKYINAKHILIQCEELADYAKILSGPKGTPVWFIDRHPMRVFKWTPDFDAYCESPIAAIWCNLIGLPIHLFDQSALFAIGKLLGTPIQVDRATANKTRLSFARICVEIDITKPPPEKNNIGYLRKRDGATSPVGQNSSLLPRMQARRACK